MFPLLGLGEERVAALRGKIAAVVNVAGVVDFNPPLDEALEVNAFGVNNLVGLAKALGAPVMHTPEFVTRIFDEELKRILHELPGGSPEEATERFTQARLLSERMILTNEFNPS